MRFLILPLAITALSCNQITTNDISPYVIDVQYNVPIEEIHNEVLRFQLSTRNEALNKSTPTMPVDQAIWSQEALANYEYAQNFFNGVDLIADTILYNIFCYVDSTGEMVSNTQDVINTYLNLSDSLSELDTNFRYQYVDIYGTVIPSQNKIQVSALAFKTPPYALTPDVITTADNYQAGLMYGHCNKVNSGDVKWRIMKHLNWNMANGFTPNNFGPYPHGNFYFTSVKGLNNSSMNGVPSDMYKLLGMPSDPYLSGSPAYNSCYRANFCIPYDRIQYYADRAWAVASYHSTANWQPIGIKIIDKIACASTPWSPAGIYNEFKRVDYGIVIIATP